jgi:hypothetical protein
MRRCRSRLVMFIIPNCMYIDKSFAVSNRHDLNKTSTSTAQTTHFDIETPSHCAKYQQRELKTRRA